MVDLILLTSTYPLGNKSETFLETEIEILAGRFRRIYILPSSRAAGVRALPANVELVEMDWLDAPGRSARYRALLSRDALRVILWTLRAKAGLRPYIRSAPIYGDILARNILRRRSLTRFVRQRGLEHAIFYDYWFENSTLALALLRSSMAIQVAVARAHRFDLYDECWDSGAVPFRDAKLTALDAVFVVSEFGGAYLAERAPRWQSKISVQKLGVRDPGQASPVRTDDVPLVVTCASLLPVKCVHQVPEVLARLGRPVRWLHLGDGPERTRVLAAAAKLDERVVWELRGHVDNRDVLRFYAEHPVDVFLSMSMSEGLPVAMMEAQSYGVPIVARGVHGVPEIVNGSTGILLAPDATASEAAAAIRSALEPGSFDRDTVRAFFRAHYEGSVNYNRFADALLALRENQAAAA